MGKRRKLGHQKPAKPAKPSSGHGGGASSGGRSGGHEKKHPKMNTAKPTSNAPPKKPSSSSSSSSAAAQHAEPTIPFAPEDKILLVGDGDLSFAVSLIEHHYCADLTASVLEKDVEELAAKYPHVRENIDKVEAEDGKVLYGVDATKMGPFAEKKGKDGGAGVMDRIIFNFPHVGGKSTDVNRQVRYNQELLVSFFERAILSLAPGGSIIVTLFEGEPYTLWNIRDLGRHCGLQVERSFKFQASAYPGYHHARTLGVVRNKAGDVGGGWKGEERPARSYVFIRKDDEARPTRQPKAKKRRRDDDEDSDGDD